MAESLSYDEWIQSGTMPWPPRRFREELAYNLYNFILDEGGKFQSLNPDSVISSDTRKYFVACINRYVNDYMDGPPSCGAMFRRYRVQDPNDDPFPLMASHGTNNPIAYPPHDGSIVRDPGEQIRQLHSDPGHYGEFNQSSFTSTREKHLIQQIESTARAFEASDFVSLYSDDLPGAGSGNRAAGSGAASIDSHPESPSRRRNREATAPDENSSTITHGSHRSKRVDTRTDKAKKSEFKHVCAVCGAKFQFPARLK